MREIKFRGLVESSELKIKHWVYYGIGTKPILSLAKWIVEDLEYTGLKDKKRKEIYEGDVLRHNTWGDTIVVWEEGMFRGQNNDHDITLADHQLKRSHIVGNIYENPNLLKVSS